MEDDIYKSIFSKNLRHYMNLNNKSQIDLINDLGFNKSAVSTWWNGTRLPRMDKVDLLAKYFNIKRSDLIEDKSLENNLTDKNAKLIADILSNNQILDHLYKVNSLNSEHQQTVFDTTDYLFDKERH